jgi:hypothetical protein
MQIRLIAIGKSPAFVLLEYLKTRGVSINNLSGCIATRHGEREGGPLSGIRRIWFIKFQKYYYPRLSPVVRTWVSKGFVLRLCLVFVSRINRGLAAITPYRYVR